MSVAEHTLQKFSKAPVLFPVLFCIFLLSNLHILTAPPCWDEILGLHNQAIWLAKHGFDLKALYVPEETYICGGSLVYHPVSVIPFVYGLLYTLFPPRIVFLLGHLFNLALLAASATLFIRILQRFSSPILTLLWFAAAFTEPILTGRMAAMGQEAALLCAAMLSLYFFFINRRNTALAAALFCCAVKFTGVILLLGFAVYYLAETLFFSEKAERKQSLKQFFAVLAALLVVFAIQQTTVSFPKPLADHWGIFHQGWGFLRNHLMQYYLYFIPLFAAAIAGTLFRLKKGNWKISSAEAPVLLLPIFVCGFTAAYFSSPVMQPLPRYTALILPGLYLWCAWSLRLMPVRFTAAFAAILILIHFGNQHGQLLEPVSPALRADISTLERSREYLEIAEQDRKLCAFIEKNKPESVILLAKWPHVQMLTMPELGYVSKAVPNVRSVGIHPRYAKAEPLTDPAILKGKIFWVVYAANCMELWFPPPFRQQEGVTHLIQFHNKSGLCSAVYPIQMP